MFGKEGFAMYVSVRGTWVSLCVSNFSVGEVFIDGVGWRYRE